MKTTIDKIVKNNMLCAMTVYSVCIWQVNKIG